MRVRRRNFEDGERMLRSAPVVLGTAGVEVRMATAGGVAIHLHLVRAAPEVAR